MDTIGNAADAELILAWCRDSREGYSVPDVVECESAPEGWRFVGHGSYRSVWESPEGVGYKVQHTEWSSQSNQSEYVTIQGAANCDLPMSSRVPVATLYPFEGEAVLAVEVIRGPLLYHYRGERQNEYYQILSQCETRLRLCDLHDENVVIDEATGDLVVVDLGG